MRYLPFLLSLGAVTVAAQSMTKCLADNCLRAIRASAFPDRSGSADCISFFQNYVIATVTATETTTISDTISITTTITTPVEAPPPDCKCKRQAPALVPAIPAYASKCSNISRYFSACACIGITEITAPTTTTTTETSTIMVSVTPTATVISFLMQLKDGHPGSYVGRAANGVAFVDSSDIYQPVQFYLLPDGHLEISGGVPAKAIEVGEGVVPIALDGSDGYPITCQIDGNQYVTCKSGPAPEFRVLGTIPVAGGNYFVLGVDPQIIEALGGQAVVVKAVPAP